MRVIKSFVAIGLVAALAFGGTHLPTLTAKAASIPKCVPATITWSEEVKGELRIQLDTSVMNQGGGSQPSTSGGDAGGSTLYAVPDSDDVNLRIVIQNISTGETVTDSHWSWRFDQDLSTTLNTSRFINESGTYVASVSLEPLNYDEFLPSETRYTTEFVYTRPANEMAVPQNVCWDASSMGRVGYDSVEGAGGYLFCLYCDGTPMGQSWSMRGAGHSDVAGYPRSVDFSRSMTKKGVYTAEIFALSPDITKIANGSVCGKAGALDVSVSADEVNKKLDNLLNKLSGVDVNDKASLDASKNDINSAVNDVQTNTAKELQIAMQVNNQLIDKVEKLETLYAAANGIKMENKVADEVKSVMDPAAIKITGAALNATPGQSISLDIKKPAAPVTIDTSKYKNAYQIEMKLNGLADSGAALKVPVQVVMPIPKNIPAYKLVILHYHNDGSVELIRPTIDYVNNTCTFLLTGFSVFAFAEEEGENGNQNVVAPVSSSNYKMGEEERSRFAYKCNQPARFEVMEAAGYEVEVVNEMQGQLFIDSVKSALNDFTLAFTYNVLTNKATNAKLENPVKLVLTVPEYVQQEGRSFEIIGVNAEGQPIVIADEDTDPNTVTFSVQDFYAFALCYKD